MLPNFHILVLACLVQMFAASGSLAAVEVASPQPVEGKRPTKDGLLPLRAVVRWTLEKNPLLDVRREAVNEAWSGEVEALAGFDPEVSANLRGSSSREAAASSELDGASQPENSAVSGGAAVAKPLRDGSTLGLEWDTLDRTKTNSSFSSLNPSYDSALRLTLRKPLMKGSGKEVLLPEEFARLASIRTVQEWRAEIESILLQVETAYWEIEARRLGTEIRRQGLAVARLLLEETEARGSTKVEVLEAKANVVRREAEVSQAGKEFKDAVDRVFLLAGVLGGYEPGQLKFDALPEVGDKVPDAGDSYAEAIRNGVEARLEENSLARASLDVERAKFGLRPTLDFAASGGLLGRDGSYGGANSALANGDGRYLDAGIELSFPWDLRAERARLQQAESRMKQERGRIDNARGELFARVRELTRRVILGQELLRAASTAVELNQARFDEQRARRAAGEVILRDVLEAQTALDEARLAELRARLDATAARLELEAARGRLPARHGLELDLRTSSTTTAL